MATQKKSVHSVGNINSRDVLTVPEVFAGENLENYSLVALKYVNGKRTATYLNAETEAYLAAAVEVVYDNEVFSEFYIGKDEGLRTVHLRKGLRFETSNYTAISGTAPAKGQFAEWDKTTKKFKLSSALPATPAAGKVFEVVGVTAGDFATGQALVRLEVK